MTREKFYTVHGHVSLLNVLFFGYDHTGFFVIFQWKVKGITGFYLHFPLEDYMLEPMDSGYPRYAPKHENPFG